MQLCSRGREEMKRLVTLIVAGMLPLALALCGQAAPPMQFPNQPPKTPESTIAPAIRQASSPAKTTGFQLTAAAAAAVSFPSPGRAISFICPWPAGGNVDLGARVLASLLEKELKTPVNIINKPGAVKRRVGRAVA